VEHSKKRDGQAQKSAALLGTKAILTKRGVNQPVMIVARFARSLHLDSPQGSYRRKLVQRRMSLATALLVLLPPRDT
jgi:hypothetical protein